MIIKATLMIGIAGDTCIQKYGPLKNEKFKNSKKNRLHYFTNTDFDEECKN